MPQKSPNSTPDKVTMSFDDYMKIVETCEEVEKNADDILADAKLRFLHRDKWPTVADLQEHKAEEHFEEMLPYLIYLADVFTPSPEEKEAFMATERYVKQLLKDHLEIIEKE